MATNKAGWFLTIGGAAAGLALAGGLLRRKRQQANGVSEEEDQGRSSGSHPVANPGQFVHKDVNHEVASALRASEHARGVQHAVSDEFAQALDTRAVDRAEARQERLEINDLLGARPLAGDAHVLARDVLDEEDESALELPIGSSAEAEIDAMLDHGVRQPDSTGVLLSEELGEGARETGEWHNRDDWGGMGELDSATSGPDLELSAQPKQPNASVSDAESSDAAADELGNDFLQRATQAPASADSGAGRELQELELADLFREAGVGVMSEASATAADPEELERAADAHLARTRDGIDIDIDDDTLADAEAEERSRT